MKGCLTVVGLTVVGYAVVALAALALTMPSTRERNEARGVQVWRSGQSEWRPLAFSGGTPQAVVRLADGRVALRDVTTMPGQSTLAHAWDPTTGAWSREEAIVPSPFDGPTDAPPGTWIRVDGSQHLGLDLDAGEGCAPTLVPGRRVLPAPSPCPDAYVRAALRGDGTLFLVTGRPPRALRLSPGAAAWEPADLPPGVVSDVLGGPDDELLLVMVEGPHYFRRGDGPWQPVPALPEGVIPRLAVGRGGAVVSAGGLLTESVTEVEGDNLAVRLLAGFFALLLAVGTGVAIAVAKPEKKAPVVIGLLLGAVVLPALTCALGLWLLPFFAWH